MFNLLLLFILISVQAEYSHCQYFLTEAIQTEGEPRYVTEKLPCDFLVDSSISGYCVCGTFWNSTFSTFGHSPFTCSSRCNECQGWKATSNCSPFSTRNVEGDLDCSSLVPSTSSGYCLCGSGKQTGFSDCRHSPFTCSSLCQELPDRFCDHYNSSLRSSSASGCSNDLQLINTLSNDISVFQVNERGIEIFVISIPASITYTIRHICLPYAFRVYSSKDRSLLLQTTLLLRGLTTFFVDDCYSPPQTVRPSSHYQVKSPGGVFEMRWGEVVGKEAEIREGGRTEYSMMMDITAMYQTTTQSFTWSRDVECPHCSASHNKSIPKSSSSSSDDIFTCPRCKGTGIERIRHSLGGIERDDNEEGDDDHVSSSNRIVMVSQDHTCPLCGGYGVIHQNSSYHCSRCQNTHIIHEVITKLVTLPEGTPQGYQVHFPGEGSQLPFSQPSDVIFTIKYHVEKPFQIRGRDLYAVIPINIEELTSPKPHSITTPIGRPLSLTYSGGPFRPETAIQVIEGEGLPIQGKPVYCRGFVVTKSRSESDRRNRKCDERIPSYLDGYCDCDGRHIEYSGKDHGWTYSCNDYQLCGKTSRGDLIVEFVVESVI